MSTAEVGGPTPRGDVLHVLVVEDDPEINELVGAYARLAGFGYRSALNGDAALTEVRRRKPDVIVLDLMLPDLDGFEICRRIKSNPETRDVPVIILTALDNEQARAKGREVGADEYLTKPFDPDRLMRSLNRHAPGSGEDKETRRQGDKETGESGGKAR